MKTHLNVALENWKKMPNLRRAELPLIQMTRWHQMTRCLDTFLTKKLRQRGMRMLRTQLQWKRDSKGRVGVQKKVDKYINCMYIYIYCILYDDDDDDDDDDDVNWFTIWKLTIFQCCRLRRLRLRRSPILSAGRRQHNLAVDVCEFLFCNLRIQARYPDNSWCILDLHLQWFWNGCIQWAWCCGSSMTLPAKMVPAHRKQLPNWQQTLARRLGPSGWLVVNRWVAGAKFHQANAELTRSLQEDPTCRSWPALKADNFHAQLTNLVFGTQHMCPWKALTSQDAAASCKDAEEKETYEAWYFDIVFNLLWIPLIFWYIPVFFYVQQLY